MADELVVPKINKSRSCCICGAILHSHGYCESCDHRKCEKCPEYIAPPTYQELRQTVADLQAKLEEKERIPEDLKTNCANCSGKGFVDRLSFSDPVEVIQKTCKVCNGKGWLWVLDQKEMAERIAALKAELEQEREDARRIIGLRQDRIDALTAELGNVRTQWNRMRIAKERAEAESAALKRPVTEELRDPEYAAGYSESYVLAFIAAQIKVLREQQGMSQAQLADKIGTQQPGIARLEDCNHTPSIGTLLKIAKAFGLRLKVSFETTESLPFEVAEFNRDSLQRASRSQQAPASEEKP